MFDVFYNICLIVLGLIALPKLLWQMCSFGKYRKTLIQRLGWKLPKNSLKTPVIWIHTVSVGETRAAIPLFRLLKKKYPEVAFYISTTTETGHLEAVKSLPQADCHFILPVDFSWVMRRLCNRLNLKMLILVESDFWYQLLSQAKKRGADVFLVNGKVSEKSKTRFNYFSCFTKRMFSHIDHLCVQSERFADRFSEMGIAREKITVTGNLKFDAAVNPLSVTEKQILKNKLKIQEKDRLIVIGSTHNLEEDRLLRALSPLFKEIPHFKVVIVPRHPERFACVSALIKSLKMPYGLFSQSDALTGEEQVILIDTMGELNRCYQLAEVAIVGGSFIDHVGGHNILEPAFFQVPVLFGPEMYGQLDLVDLVIQTEAGLQVTLEQLPKTVRQWLEHSGTREKYIQGTGLLSSQIQGSSERTLKALIAFQKNI